MSLLSPFCARQTHPRHIVQDILLVKQRGSSALLVCVSKRRRTRPKRDFAALPTELPLFLLFARLGLCVSAAHKLLPATALPIPPSPFAYYFFPACRSADVGPLCLTYIWTLY